jgi:hypothetical protein
MTLLSLLLVASCGGSAQAETISVSCEESQSWQSPAMTLVYEGADSGTLTIKGEFGEMALPATKEKREGPDEQGGTRSVVGIRASGPAKVIMPDKKAAEECAKGKLTGDQAQDKDIVFVTMMGCLGTVPKGTEPVDINAYTTVALLDPPDAYVEFIRTYVEPSNLPGSEPVKVESFVTCRLAQ